MKDGEPRAVQEWLHEKEERSLEVLERIQQDLETSKAMIRFLVEEQPAQTRRRNMRILMFLIFSCVAYINIGYPVLAKITASPVAKKIIEPITKSSAEISSDMKQTPRKGDKVGPFIVTSPWGKRNTGIPGASTYHRGVDLGTPIGTPLYAIAPPGETVKVKCWWDDKGGGRVASYTSPSVGFHFDYLHLSKCANGKYKGGTIIARSGDTGVGGLPHAHIQQKEDGKKIPPYRKFVWWAITGKEPNG